MSEETPLIGGRSRTGIVRVGDTVRRPLHDRSSWTHRVLRRLEGSAIIAPRFLGIDDQGREILTYLPGRRGDNVLRRAGQTGQPDDNLLGRLACWMADFHHLLRDTPEAGTEPTVRHGDLAPWNMIMNDSGEVGFIDFDDARPGRAEDDVAYLLWTFLNLGDPHPDDQTQLNTARETVLRYQHHRGAQLHDLGDALCSEIQTIVAMRTAETHHTNPAVVTLARKQLAQAERSMRWAETHRTVFGT